MLEELTEELERFLDITADVDELFPDTAHRQPGSKVTDHHAILPTQYADKPIWTHCPGEQNVLRFIIAGR